MHRIMTKEKFIILLLSFILIFFGCRNSSEKILKNYLEYIKNENYDKAYKLLSAEDKRAVSLDEFSINDSIIARVITRYNRFNIIESTPSETNNTITFVVEVKQPNLQVLYQKIPGLYNNNNLLRKDIEKLIKKNNKILQESYITKTANFSLIREGENWKIYANFGRKKLITDLKRMVVEHEKNGEFDLALEYLDKILSFEELDIEMYDAYKRIMEKKDYIERNIKIDKQVINNEVTITFLNKGTYVIKELTLLIQSIAAGNIIEENMVFPIIKEDQKSYIGFEDKITIKHIFKNNIKNNTKVVVKIINIDF